MSQSINFLDVDSRLRVLFDQAEMTNRWNPLDNFGTGRHVSPATILSHGLSNVDLVTAFLAELDELADQPLPDDLDGNPTANAVFAYVARLGVKSTADETLDRTIGRPGNSFATVIGIGSFLTYLASNFTTGVFARPDYRRGMLTHLLSRDPTDLLEAFGRWFGPQSVGLLSGDERTAVLESIDAAVSEETLQSHLTWWTDNEGDAEYFRTFWWTNYLEGMGQVRRAVTALPLTSDVRRGYLAYEEKLSRLRIGHTIDQIREWAAKQYALVETEANRIAVLAGFADWKRMWTSYPIEGLPRGDGLVDAYRETCPDVIGTLLREGLIPPQPDDFTYTIDPTQPEVRVQIPIAACYSAPYGAEDGAVRSSTFIVTPTESDHQLIRQHHFSQRIAIAHELGAHGWAFGLAPHVVPLELVNCDDTRLVGLEGVAFSMELQFLLSPGVDPTLEEMLALLHGRLWRYSRILAETSYHLTDTPLDEIIDEYAERSQISSEMARKDMRRAAQEIWQFVAYAFGASGVQQMDPYFPGGMREALARFQAECAGFVPQHIFLEALGLIENAESFNWLCETDAAVLASHELFG